MENGFVRLRAVDGANQPAAVRVDLVDREGRRFSVVENLGRNPHLPRENSLLLAYRSFHPWVFGRALPGRFRMNPPDVREIQLRFYGGSPDALIRVKLEAVGFEAGGSSQAETQP